MDRHKAPVSQRKPQRASWLRIAVLIIVVVVLVPAVGLGLFIAQFNPNAYAPQIIAAVQRATGRTLTINGPIRLKLSLTPTLAANDLSLANPAGYADPSLLTLDQVEAQIALIPLLRHQVDVLNLKLSGLKLYLERNATGQADWDFSNAALPPAANPPAAASQPANAASRYKFALESVALDNGQIAIRPQGPAQPDTIQLTRLTGQAASLTAPLYLSGSAAIGNAPLTLQGVVGPVARLTGTGSNPWPIDLTFGFAGATAHLQGNVTRPQSASGYNVTVAAAIPALETVGAALPPNWLGGPQLPALHNVTAKATITDQGSSLPAISNVSIKAGASALSSLRPGLTLAALDLEMPSLGGSATLSAKGTLGQLPFVIQGNTTAPDAFIPPALLPATNPPAANFSESLNASLGNASLSLTGGIATPRTLTGAAMALTLKIPDLSVLSPAVGQPLPAWQNIAVKTTLIDPGGQGLEQAIGLNSLTATMDNASFGGDAKLTLRPAPKLEIDLSIAKANLDALLAAWPAAQPAPAAAMPSQPQPAQIVPDIALPLNLLRQATADVLVKADSLTYGGATYTALQGHAVLNNGVLTVNPLTGQLPGGAISASGSIDASEDPAAETLKFNAPALALGPFLHGFGITAPAQGTVQAQLNASARGNTLPDMLASVSGQLGVASVNGVVDGSVIGHIFGGALQSVGLPENLVASPGPVSVRCAALRLDSNNGSGTVKALALDSSRLLMQGGGTMNFADETLGLVLKPWLKIQGSNVIVPVQVGGTFLKPSYSVAPQSAVAAAAQVASGLSGTGSPLQQTLGANTLLGKALGTMTGSGSNADICPAALSLARMGQPGSTPAAPPSNSTAAPAPATSAQPSNTPRSLLNSLIGQ
ncbi:MAG: AsmA family protein [Proteobacteria bacterium]|nr:AsmA family protein [Pseudomonadota bacterium]MBU6425989.1 AsmA family protein [Rhodospirillales bacterium]